MACRASWAFCPVVGLDRNDATADGCHVWESAAPVEVLLMLPLLLLVMCGACAGSPTAATSASGPITLLLVVCEATHRGPLPMLLLQRCGVDLG